MVENMWPPVGLSSWDLSWSQVLGPTFLTCPCKGRAFVHSTNACCCCSVTKLYPTLFDPMNCSMPGSSVHHYLPEFAQTHIQWVSDAIQPSHPLSLPSPSCPQFFPASVSQLFTAGGQSTRPSASASVLSMNIHGWFPLELTDLISLLFKGLSRVFSSTIVQKHPFSIYCTKSFFVCFGCVLPFLK